MEARSSGTPEPVPAPAADPVPDRRCGRCQGAFPGDPGLTFQTDWAVCPACAAVLMPRPPTPAPAS